MSPSSHGATIAVISKKIGVSDHTYYRWRKEYGGIRIDQARHFKELERENSCLKRLVADLSLDNAIAVLPGAAWFDEEGLDTHSCQLFAYRPGGELRAVVGANVLRDTPENEQVK